MNTAEISMPTVNYLYEMPFLLLWIELDQVYKGRGRRLYPADEGGQYAEWHLSGGGEHHVTGQHGGLGNTRAC